MAETQQKRVQGLSYFIVFLWSALALLLCLNQVFSLRIFGFYPVGYEYYFIGLYLPICFLISPAMKRDAFKIPWYDWALFILCVVVCCYLGYNGLKIIDSGWEYKAPLVPTVAGFFLILLCLEAVRRMGGLPLFIICFIFAFYPMYSQYMPKMFWGPSKSFLETVWAHSMGAEGIIGIALKMAGHLLPGFIFFGVAMVSTGGGKFFMDFANALLGRTRGGPAKVCVMGSGFFGMISGSVVANISTIGTITIPVMKKIGYPAVYAAAIETCASTGGCLMPPVMGAAAFLIAAFLSVSYWEVCKAAFLPAVLFYLCLLFQVDQFAARNKIKGLDKSEIPRIWDTLKTGWFHLFSIAALIYFLLYLRVESWGPFFATAFCIIFSMFQAETRLNWKKFAAFIVETGRLMGFIVAILASIGLIVGSLSVTGVGNAFARELVLAAGGNIILMLLFGTFASFILGMGMTVTACYIFLAVILVPALVQSGLNPMGSHLFVMYWGMVSYITPPVALGAITAAALAGSNPMRTGYRAMRLGITLYILPYLFVLNPSLLGQGPVSTVLLDATTAIIGVAFISSALENWVYGIGTVNIGNRILICISGLLFLYPNWKWSLIGLAVAGIVYIPHLINKREEGKNDKDTGGTKRGSNEANEELRKKEGAGSNLVGKLPRPADF